MIAVDRFSSRARLLVVLAVTSVGCQTTVPVGSTEGDIGPQRELRLQALAHEFDESRNTAEFHAAEARWTEGDTQGCIERLEKLLRRSPDHLESRLLLAELLLCEDRPLEALQWIQPAVTSHAEDARVHHTMGLLLEKMGRGNEAQEYYEEAAGGEPDNQWYGTVEDRSALPLEKAYFDELTDGKNRTVTTAHVASTPSAAAIRDSGPCTADHPDVLKKPKNPQIPISDAVAALRQGNAELAIDLLEPALGVCTDSAALYRILGTAYYRRGDFRASQVALQQALSLDKSSALSYFLMGCTLVKLGRLETAEEHFLQAAAIDPKYAACCCSG